MEGHIEGMLDRDQRTAKLPICNCTPIAQTLGNTTTSTTTSSTCNSTSSTRKTKKNSTKNQINRCPHCSYIWKSDYFLTTIQKFKQALIIGIYLTLITFPRTLSAPTTSKMSDDRLKDPKWINPCGVAQATSHTDYAGSTGSPAVNITDYELTSQIINQSNIGLGKAEDAKNNFVMETLKMNFDDVQKHFGDQHYDWLPKFPKKLNEPIPDEHLGSLKFHDVLLDTYGYLQTIAVGLEQVVWDQIDNHSKYKEMFSTAEYNLRNVLCEIQMAILEQSLQMRPDVKRDVMPSKYRVNLDNTSRKTRDWIIFREYMNGLEYVNYSFTHLRQAMPHDVSN